MGNGRIKVVAHVRAKEGKVEELKKVMLGLIEPTRKEAGCIRYELYQNKQEAADLTFVEDWESDAALDAHMQTPHFLAAVAQIPSLVCAPPDIRRYWLVG